MDAREMRERIRSAATARLAEPGRKKRKLRRSDGAGPSRVAETASPPPACPVVPSSPVLLDESPPPTCPTTEEAAAQPSHAEAPSGGDGTGTNGGPIFQPKWSVTEGSTVFDEGTAVDLASHMVTPRDAADLEGCSYEKLRRLAYASVSMAGLAVRGIEARASSWREKYRVQQVDLKNLRSKLSQVKAEQRRLAAACKEAEDKVGLLEQAKAKAEAEAEEKEGFLQLERARARRASEETQQLRSQLDRAPEAAVEAFKASPGYIDGLLEAYGACWEDAATICREQGQTELAALMDDRARRLKDTAPEGSDEEAEEEEDGAPPLDSTAGEHAGETFPEVPQDLQPLSTEDVQALEGLSGGPSANVAE